MAPPPPPVSEDEAPAEEAAAPIPVVPKAAAKPAAGGDASGMATDLKIKIANVSKDLLNLEMQNITGELSDEEFKSKTERLNQLKAKMEQQIQELEG